MKWMRAAVAGAFVVFWIARTPVLADVRLPRIFGDHMVLQRDQPIPVWGWAEPGEKVAVQLGEGEQVQATAADDGRWLVRLAAQPAGGPTTLRVSGENRLELRDVLVGEVWICSGQSNMEWAVRSSLNAEQEIANAEHPRIRHIKIPRRPAGFPQQDVDAAWTACTPETVGAYTAVGYFFARQLRQELDVPIGLINTSWGGTRIEPWTPPCGLAQVPALADILKRVNLTNPANTEYQAKLSAYLEQLTAWLESARHALESEQPLEPPPAYPPEIQPLASHQDPTTLYNGMVHPLVPFAMRGAIWYQGESNHSEGMLYYEKKKALIAGWRAVWKQGAFPFLYVQIAPFQYGDEAPGILPLFWEAQTRCLEIPNTGMAVVHDIGNLKDIHPRNKQDVGKRLALIALARTYGRTDLEYSGPMFRSLAVEGDQLRVTFDHAGNGLMARDGKPLSWFEIIGPETDFVKAQAVIEGDSVVLSSPQVKQPTAVRFAWHKLAEPNLANKAGLPAVPFRAGKIPQRDWLKLKIDEAQDYALAYDLDLGKLGPDIQYDVNRAADITQPFDRIAYFLELRKPGGQTNYVYVSLDAFTDDVRKIGIPTVASGAKFQTGVTNLRVISNVSGLPATAEIDRGNIEFWPNNYGPANGGNVPNARSDMWDFGDQPADPVSGYGSMQVHHYQGKQTLFGINHWTAGNRADIGIGNSDGETRDWTFTANAASYEVKRLRVLVRLKNQ